MLPPLSETTLLPLLRRLRREGGSVLLETSRPDAENRRTLPFRGAHEVLRCTAATGAAAFLEAISRHLAAGRHLAGWFAYEFGCLLEPCLAPRLPDSDVVLAELGVFAAPLCFDHASGAWSGPLPEGADGDDDYTLGPPVPSEDQGAFEANIARIKEYIAAGDTYQVNYTFRLRFPFSGSAVGLYRDLRRNQPVAHGAMLDLGGPTILSFSPELFFRKQGRRCTVRPMKGTMLRGRTPEEDARRADFLRHDPKNRAENVMIVDLLRNDLGRLCEMGSVRAASLFDIETYRTLHQMTSTIEGRLRPGAELAEIMTALFPCGSVTGAPKIRTMEIISELEATPRGVYTGAIGYLAPDGDMAFNVPIRTVVLDGDRGEMGIGAGITHDSDPTAEWLECLLKGEFLTRRRPPFELIETLLWERAGERFFFLEEHLDRLTASARYFGIACDRGQAAAILRQQAAEAARRSPAASFFRLRLLCAEDGTLSTGAVPCPPPSPFHLPSTTGTTPAATITISRHATDAQSPLLYHKTTQRRLYDREREQAVAAGHTEVVFKNQRGEITEGAISNIAIRRQGQWLTPALSCGLLPGVCRQRLLAAGGGKLREAVISEDDLRTAEAVCIMNSVRGVVPVRLSESPLSSTSA